MMSFSFKIFDNQKARENWSTCSAGLTFVSSISIVMQTRRSPSASTQCWCCYTVTLLRCCYFDLP